MRKSGPLPWLILVLFLCQFVALYYATGYDDDCHGCGVWALFGVLWLTLVVLLVGLVVLWLVLRWRGAKSSEKGKG